MTMFDTPRKDASASASARALLLEHARASAYRRELPEATAIREEENPLCGDRVKIFVQMRDDHDHRVIAGMTFTGTGCIISQAAASLVCEQVVGKNCSEVTRLGLADMEGLLGVALTPSRVTCAMLPLVALQNLLEGRDGGITPSASIDR